ncbi:uncharacterized protein LOC140704447 [Pogona vitticeps]
MPHASILTIPQKLSFTAKHLGIITFAHTHKTETPNLICKTHFSDYSTYPVWLWNKLTRQDKYQEERQDRPRRENDQTAITFSPQLRTLTCIIIFTLSCKRRLHSAKPLKMNHQNGLELSRWESSWTSKKVLKVPSDEMVPALGLIWGKPFLSELLMLSGPRSDLGTVPKASN